MDAESHLGHPEGSSLHSIQRAVNYVLQVAALILITGKYCYPDFSLCQRHSIRHPLSMHVVPC